MSNEDAHRYGSEEWKAMVLTNEFHRHLGAYSIIGAKMGIRAREILEAPFDTLRVVSHAGDAPPLSCLNDGLQMATGASLGRGSIQVQSGASAPSAVFFGQDRTITLALKKDVVQRIKKISAKPFSHSAISLPNISNKSGRFRFTTGGNSIDPRIFDERK